MQVESHIRAHPGVPPRPRVGVVGLGWMGRDHARVLAAHPGVDLVAVVDTDPQRSRDVASQVGARAAGSVGEVLGELDALSVCTPDRHHEELVVAALESGVRVLVEKPLATDVAAARRMVNAAWDEAALSVGHLLDADPRIERTRQLITQGRIGTLWHVRVRRHAGRAVASHVAGTSSVGWFGTIHDADLLLSLTGAQPQTVHAHGVRGLLTDTWDVIDAVVRMSDGLYATLHESWTLPAGRANRSDSGIALIGSNGGIEIDLGHGQLLVSDEATSTAPDVMHYPSSSLADTSDLQVELDRWVRSLDGVQHGVSGARALRAVELVEAIHRSLATGEPEHLRTRTTVPGPQHDDDS